MIGELQKCSDDNRQSVENVRTECQSVLTEIRKKHDVSPEMTSASAEKKHKPVGLLLTLERDIGENGQPMPVDVPTFRKKLGESIPIETMDFVVNQIRSTTKNKIFVELPTRKSRG